jgi:hypothetical protein
MSDPVAIANRYISVWNETNPDRRRALLERVWTEDGTYCDPLMRGAGYAEIDGLIGAVHTRFPGFRFALEGRPDGHANHIRFSWALGPQGEPAIIKGTDFAVLEGDRLKAVTGFLDLVPAGA